MVTCQAVGITDQPELHLFLQSSSPPPPTPHTPLSNNEVPLSQLSPETPLSPHISLYTNWMHMGPAPSQ